MNSSYKIALLLTVVLCGVILGYYVTRDDPAKPDDVAMADPTQNRQAPSPAADRPAAPANPGPSRGGLPAVPDRPASTATPPGSSATGRSLLDSVNAHVSRGGDGTSANPGGPLLRNDTPSVPPPASVVTPPRETTTTTPPTDARSLQPGSSPATPASAAPPTAATPQPARPTVTDIPPNTGRAALRPTTPLTGRTYTIKENDTLSSIARQTMGSESHWQAIAEANPYLDPRRLKIGQVIRLPDPPAAQGDAGAGTPAAASPGDAPRTAGPVEYVVKSNDTLSRIARVHYGDPNLWEVIYRANRTLIGSDPAGIRPGMKLFIPPEPRTAH